MIYEIESDDVACCDTPCIEFEDCLDLKQTLDNTLALWCDRLRGYLSLPSPHLDTRHIHDDLCSMLRVLTFSKNQNYKILLEYVLYLRLFFFRSFSIYSFLNLSHSDLDRSQSNKDGILTANLILFTFVFMLSFLKLFIHSVKTRLFFSSELDISYILSDSRQLKKASKINE